MPLSVKPVVIMHASPLHPTLSGRDHARFPGHTRGTVHERPMVLRTTPMGENGRDNATSRSFRAAAEEVGSGADHHEQHKRTPGHLFSTDHGRGGNRIAVT